ncbi:MAG: hypothetical protein E6R03_01585 [Hyphomicrobiaceae bacterium]|nr:MAG: hypothetical protein E6R03_01585 [Hyphomicrobiaceae bacterium]
MRMPIFAFLLFALRANAADWYLDSAATGAGNGTNWSNAWTTPSAVVWGGSGVKAGDTLWFSGASTGKVYSSVLTFGASGNATSRINVKISKDVGHNGTAVLPAFSINTRTNVTIDGSISDSFVAATNPWLLDGNTNNMGFRTIRTNGVGLYITGVGGIDTTVRYVRFGPHGSIDNIGDINAIQIQNLSEMRGLVFEYLAIHDVQGDGINLNSVTTNPTNFDAFVVRYCTVDRTGDDGIQSTRNGFTLQNCALRDHWIGLYNGHPDHLQFSGTSSRYLKIINNVFRNKANSLIIGELYATEGGTIGPMWIVGNVFFTTSDWFHRDIQAYGATFDAWRPNGDNGGGMPPYSIWSVETCTIDDLQVLNNTFHFQRTIPFKIGRATPADNTDGDGRGTRSVWKLFITNSAVVGNVFLDCKYNAGDVPSVVSITGNGAPGSGTNGVYYNAADFVLSNNIVAGQNRYVSYNGTAATADTFGGGNGTNRPNINTNTYVLSSADTVAKDMSIPLLSVTNRIPEILTDMTGTTRGADGSWDIGALEYSPGLITSGLVMRIDFSDSFADGILTDSSPTGAAPALRFGKVGSPTNWPTPITVTNPFTGNLMPAANFEWYYNDGYGNYSKSGDYAGVTNVGAFKSLNQMSVFCWHLYDQVYTNIPSEQTWTPDNNATLIAGDFGEKGNWLLGRNGNDFPQLILWPSNSGVVEVSLGSIQDRTYNAPYGYSRTLKHFGFTWDNGTAIIYSNAVPVATNTTTAVTNLVVRRWLGLGCRTHGDHDPQLGNGDGYDEWPNNGWLNGWLADARIYNRVVSRSEVSNIVYQTEASWVPPSGDGGGEEGGGGGSSTGKHSIRATVANVGRITGP